MGLAGVIGNTFHVVFLCALQCTSFEPARRWTHAASRMHAPKRHAEIGSHFPPLGRSCDSKLGYPVFTLSFAFIVTAFAPVARRIIKRFC